jgi:PAS domain S-box-containing protein
VFDPGRPEKNSALRIDPQSIVEAVRESLIILDSNLRVRMANRSFYETFRVSVKETEGRRIYELGDGEWNVPALRTLLEEILPENSTFDGFEVAHDFPSIGPRVMLLNARRIPEQSGVQSELILLAIEDVSDRRRAEEQRREIETRFTSLVENVADHAIVGLDPEGRIRSWNIAAERILGYSEEEAVGEFFSVIFTPEDRRDAVPEGELRTARAEGRCEDERWHMRKGGAAFWALGVVTPIYDTHGVLSGFSKICAI